jgi:aminopeptidase N
MAEFMPGQYWGATLGRHAEEDYYLDEYREYLEKDARRRTPLATWNSNNVYPKGALVLWMLQKELGREAFWAAIHRYLTSHAYGNATSDDLRQAVLDATGRSLPWFWSQWIYQAGYPEFSVSSQYDPAGSALVLTVRQTQQDTATADSTGLRFSVPQAFRAPMVIRVGTASGDVVTRVTIDHREQVVRVDGVRSPPTMVSFDDENAVVKTLEFNQPTAWLAALLQRRPGLWQRSWAIDQLVRRTDDTLAARALARAAVESDYDATRARAAGALQRFPAGLALPALERAAGDTSSRVREAAVAALSGLSGERARELVQRAWRRDRSYDVRAAALRAMVRLDPVGSRQAVTEALRTPSYRDVIQNAAISSVVEHPDSGLVLGVEAVAGDQPLAAYGLAALASRGDATARAALERLLQDRRDWVREWAREATGME